MPKFAANLTMLYNELGFLDRFRAARTDGFTGIEFLFPYTFSKAQLGEALAENGLVQVLHNLPAGDWEAGDRGIACLPDRSGEFQDGVGLAIDYAKALQCPQVNCLAGIAPKNVSSDKIRQTFVDNLKFSAKKLADAGIRLLIEPINTKDIPGFYLTRTDQAAEIMDAVGSNNLFLQYDVYHTQRMEGDLVATFKRLKSRIAHVQIADNPGRNEPGTGEINYRFIFGELDREGYAGWVGCEYRPRTTTSAGLEWASSYLQGTRE
jgi:hydroxypyruvate isomerase